jgi:hypothetical protein
LFPHLFLFSGKERTTSISATEASIGFV